MNDRVKVKRVIHAIHAVRDIGACREKYLNLLGGMIFAEGYFEPEDRDMALLYASNFMIEPMCPRNPERTDKGFSRFMQAHGECWHSFEIGVEDGPTLSAKIKESGPRVSADYGFFFFVPVESTGGVLLEVCAGPMPNDPYDRGNWNPEVMRGHGSTLRRLDHIACVVPKLEPTLELFTEIVDGEIISDTQITAPQAARRVLIQLGDAKIAFIEPKDASAGPLGTFLKPPSAGIYGLVWQVEDEARAEAFFHSKKVRTTREANVSAGFAIDPEDFLGARHEFIAA